ncbi:HNH endonuclease signature motif containing protein, partial [Streptomyces sp. B6B3]|uniref:HNH endonuclease n=1 Tax=Streptomyces sp. B6B3 TaxID=3153570 RepID=UPI00325F056B
AHRCDIDHIQPFNHQDPDAGGPTEPDNLMALCRRHHRVKHQTPWSVERDTTTDQITWTAPTGHHYSRDPHTYAA